jgi:SpoVK/Ycf46/Vps4 family AAA+-type ATPase
MSTDILRIIEGGLTNDKRKIVNYAMRLAERLKADGDVQLSKCIVEQIESSTHKNAATADAMRMIPLDVDSKLQIVEVVPESTGRTDIVLSNMVQQQVEDFIKLINNSTELELAGLNVKKSMLLYGAPGCGKTSIAHYISEKTGLPLVVARLDAIVSSLLGSTAKNLARIFSYVNSMPCILLLDEFDAIAKARDDNHELGELKRVINSLLQNIDAMSPSTILIAATNHPDLLDKAVWRRFYTRLEVGLPDDESRKQIIRNTLKGFSCTILEDENRMKMVSDLMAELSPSDICTLLTKLKVKSVIEGSKEISYEQVLAAIYEFGGKDEPVDKFIVYLNKYGVAQKTISEMLNTSLRQVRNVLNNK